MRWLWAAVPFQYSWASASRSMPLASAFRHPVSQSNTGAFQYRTGFPYSGTGLVPASEFLFIPVPDWLLLVVVKGKSSALPNCRKWKVIHPRLLMVLFLLYDIKKSYVNARMPEISPALAFLSVVSCLSPTSAFRHQGSVWYRRSRISPALPCPAMPFSTQFSLNEETRGLSKNQSFKD